jgi:hypothetical protein
MLFADVTRVVGGDGEDGGLVLEALVLQVGRDGRRERVFLPFVLAPKVAAWRLVISLCSRWC